MKFFYEINITITTFYFLKQILFKIMNERGFQKIVIHSLNFKL